MPEIIVRFAFDRWEVIRRYGFRETLIGYRANKSDADRLATIYRTVEGK